MPRIAACWLLISLPFARAEVSPWSAAERNASQANESFARCHRFVEGWLKHRDPQSGLFPQNLRSPQWTAHNSAADLWSFMVLTAHFTDRQWYDGLMRNVLHTEIRLTTRIRRLPDSFSFRRQDFVSQKPDLKRIIFGASEYAKDGLLPITEVVGRDEWFFRMRDLVDDILAEAPVVSKWGRLPADDTEVNGEMLQTLSRLFCATSDTRYWQAATRIADAYLFEVLPACNGLPVHRWDFAQHRLIADRLSLNDHGNEIIGGLSEVFLLSKFCDPQRFSRYQRPMRKLLDTLLEKFTNDDGLWVGGIVPTTLAITREKTPDTWGYALNGVYTAYLATGDERYRAAVERALHNIDQDRYLRWGGADAFADSLESGLVLLNRVSTSEGWDWVEKMARLLLDKQQPDGVIEGWHGDGNYARTALMYALYKTRGVRAAPWRADLRFGAVPEGDGLRLAISAGKPWQGRLFFDFPRHRDVMGLPLDYPRLNSYPQWWTAEWGRLYDVDVEGDVTTVMGGQLIGGWPLSVQGGRSLHLTVTPRGEPPYGQPPIQVTGPTVLAGDGQTSASLTLTNVTQQPQRVVLETDWGQVNPARLQLSPGESADITLTGTVASTSECHLSVHVPNARAVTWAVRLVHQPGLIDMVNLCGDESYRDECYRWTGDGPIEFRLKTRPGAAAVLWLRWGAKKDQRAAVVRIGDHERSMTHGGYDGFQWLSLPLPAESLAARELTVNIRLAPGRKGAFISQARLLDAGAAPQ